MRHHDVNPLEVARLSLSEVKPLPEQLPNPRHDKALTIPLSCGIVSDAEKDLEGGRA